MSVHPLAAPVVDGWTCWTTPAVASDGGSAPACAAALPLSSKRLQNASAVTARAHLTHIDEESRLQNTHTRARIARRNGRPMLRRTATEVCARCGAAATASRAATTIRAATDC